MKNCNRISVQLMLDENGDVWSSGGTALRRHFNSRLTNSALCDYLITNIGWIGVERAREKMTIYCRPAFVPERARAALYYYLFDQQIRRVTLHLLGDEWQQFESQSPRDAMDLLEGMAMGAMATYGSMTACPVAPEASPLTATWAAVNQLTAKSPTLEGCQSALELIVRNQRWTISHFDHKNLLIVDRKGQGFKQFNERWTNDKRAHSLVDYAGSEYASWIATTRKLVARSKAVMFEKVDATLSFPQTGLRRISYHRATASMTLANGKEHLLTIAVAKHPVDCW